MAANPKIVIICGPTGLGKTSTAIELAEKFNAEIIGADSMQIYRCMDIGTAKPTVEEQRRVKHHLIDCVNPDEDYDAARYAKEASAEIEAFIQQDILPFVVGGTGFYIKALLYGLFEGKSADAAVRQRLKQEAAATGL
nr:tRNA (adenosine(37)-N6)-dimethylallyltransferase MiaA [Desulfobacterales bacterium]